MSLGQSPLSFYKAQRGQLFSGYIVAIFVVMGMVIFASAAFVKQKQLQERQRHRNWAENVAKLGFDSAVSYFRNDPSGRYLPDAIAPVSQAWQGTSLMPTSTTPWMAYPDLAFAPTQVDTDYWDLLSVTAQTALTATPYAYNTLLTTAARAIMRTIPLYHYTSLTTITEVRGSGYWGRFVVKRQPVRNWSPGSNSYAAFTDKDAVHDLSHLKDNVRPGSGTTWSIVSNGYVFRYHKDLSLTAEIAGALEGGDITGAPLAKYLGKPLLLARAKVYGEITRINILNPTAAVWVNQAMTLTVKCNGAVIARGGGNYAYAANVTTTGSPNFNSGCASPNTNGSYVGALTTKFAAPSVSTAFPGQTMGTLKAVALALSSQTTTTKVGTSAAVFPLPTQAGFEEVVSTNSFYFIDGNAILSGGIAARRMSGIGVVIVNGDLTIPTGNPSEFSGIVFVDGTATLGPGVNISGILIATRGVILGQTGSSLKTQIEFNQDAIDNARDNVLRSFQVLESSVVAVN